MPSLYVIRHAEPRLKGVLLGQTDPPLSDAGLQEAARISDALPRCPVYSSPLLRARQTAELIGRNVVILSGLAEISYGEWDGLPWAEIELKWPVITEAKLRDWEGVIPPGGEAWSEFTTRVRDALSYVTSGVLPAVIIAHEAVNAVIALELRGGTLHSYKQNYCEITEYCLPPGARP